MGRLHGAWPRSVAVVGPGVVFVAAILAAAGAVPTAFGFYGALFPWLLLLPVSTTPQLTAARGIHLVVWTTAFFPAPRWFFFAATMLLSGGLVTLGRADRDGESFGGATPAAPAPKKVDETVPFL